MKKAVSSLGLMGFMWIFGRNVLGSFMSRMGLLCVSTFGVCVPVLGVPLIPDSTFPNIERLVEAEFWAFPYLLVLVLEVRKLLFPKLALPGVAYVEDAVAVVPVW